ncbi:MAG: type VI secretion system baseplate subunit TssF [Planctomycetes bacterium]|nr:type VI secretion system baseplate subunit TssF [Planctomycetota bacterium]
MSDDLLDYFERELDFLREMGAEFAGAHPKIAGRLRLSKNSKDSIDDPHVARLIQSIAFLNARTRKKLDDDYPELAQAILGVISPHHLAPVPSMAIVQFDCSPGLTTSYQVPAGTVLETDLAYGPVCNFTTIYDTTTWPVRIADVALLGAPFQAPRVARASGASSVLRIRLETAEDQCPIGELGIDRLRFHLRGQPRIVQQLYELLLADVSCVAIAGSSSDAAPTVLGPECLQPVGFELGESLLPQTGRSQPGAVLLTEYFVFPDKFQFVDLLGIPTDDPGRFGAALEIYIFTTRRQALEQAVGIDTLALGCTPVVNLYSRRADPIELSEAKAEYHVVPDARTPDVHEIYSISAVAAVSRDGARRDYTPFYGYRHPAEGEARQSFWHAQRRDAPASTRDRNVGTEMYLSLVDLDARPNVPNEWILETKVLCLNRNRPSLLPFGGGEPRLRFSEGGGGIDAIRCLTPFTATRRQTRGRGALWRLVSQLSLNHLSITGGEEGAEALREILRVNDLADNAVTQSIIASIKNVDSRPTMIRIRIKGELGLCRGTEIRVELDEDRLQGSGAYQFAVVLGRFLASYSSVNSFVQLVTTSRTGTAKERRWPPRSGTRELV